jgi:hypothetical protein
MSASKDRLGERIGERALSVLPRALSPRLINPGLLAVPMCAGVVSPWVVSQVGTRVSVFLLGAGFLAGLGFSRRSFAIVATIGAFVVSGLLRRLYPAADATADPAAIFPFIVAVPLVVAGLRSRKSLGIVLFLGWISVAAGISLRSPTVAIGAWINLAVPLLAAIAIVSSPRSSRTLMRALVVAGSVAATYGLIQYRVPLFWDLNWIDRSGFVSAGRFGESTFRPFATYASVGTGATVTAIVFLVVVFRWKLTGFSPSLRVLALVPITLYILVAQVRAVWIAVIVATIAGLMVARDRPLIQVLAPVLIGSIALSVFPQAGFVGEQIGTLPDISQERTYQSRLDLLSGAGDLLSPVGRGLGQLSAASRAEGGAGIDNGYLVILGESGLVGLVLTGWLLVLVSRQGGRPGAAFLVLLLVMNLAGFAFANIPGLLLWSLAGTDTQAVERSLTAGGT